MMRMVNEVHEAGQHRKEVTSAGGGWTCEGYVVTGKSV